MDCDDAESQLARLVDADLETKGARALYSHLDACANCRELFANILLVKVMCKAAWSVWGKQKTGQGSKT